ncbi:MAG: acyl-CoA dehydrogenase [Candidatus Dadabacteria bacterium]|nr:MAG: acyl-CoA dehydrogenase [Candidatus Dadabacteria bacterium]
MGWEDGFHFELSDEEQMVQETARSFAKSAVEPLAAKIDREHYYPGELVKAMGELGFMGATVPEEYGGAGLSNVAYSLIIEELAAACASTAIIMSAHNSLCISPIQNFGTEEQKKKWLPDLAAGKKLGCFALSEPGTGSDAANLSCTVEKRGDKYIVNGTKNWITNGPKADVAVLFASIDRSKGHKGIAAFVHSLDLKGVTRGKPEDKLGICGSPTSSLIYDSVELTAENLLGDEHGGFKVAMHTLNGGRIGVASQAVGIARASLADALRYAKERKTFGRPIGEHQSIQNYLADMVTRIDASRYLTLSAARLKDSGRQYIREASMAKLFASETARFCADRCVQIHGGYGYVKEFPAERHLRDAKITEIYEGTSEIQRIVIGSRLMKE